MPNIFYKHCMQMLETIQPPTSHQSFVFVAKILMVAHIYLDHSATMAG